MKKSRMRVNVGDEELHITIPARRHPLTILIFVVWSVVIIQFLHDALGGIVTGRMLITAIVCMLPGVAGLCWILLGREEIRITEGNLVRRVHVGPIGFTRAYALADARNFRLAQLPPNVMQAMRAGPFPFGPAGGSVHFDYGRRMERLGAGLSEDEVPELLEVLAPFVKRR